MSENILNKLISSLIYLLTFSLLLSLAVTSVRYYQKYSNVELLKNEKVHAKPLLSYYDKQFLQDTLSIRNVVNNIISGNTEEIRQRDLYKSSIFGDTIGYDYLEVKSSQILLSKKDASYFNENYKIKYLIDTLLPSIRKKMMQNDYENARYRAQRFINYYNKNPESFTYNNRKLMYVRKTINMVKGNYLYDSKDIIKLIDDINWHDDFQWRANKKGIEDTLLNARSSKNINYKEYIDYALSDIRENSLDHLGKVGLWGDYIDKYPDEKLTAEAYFNQLIELFSMQLQSLLESEELYGQITINFYKIADRFMSQYKKSYLIDDALQYSIIFAGLDRNEKLISYLKILFSGGNRHKSTQLQLAVIFKMNDLDYMKFFSDAVKTPVDASFDQYSEYTRLNIEYLRQLKRELYRFEGKNYGELTIKNIIINIAARNLGELDG